MATSGRKNRGLSMTIAAPGIGGDFRIGTVLNRAWEIFSTHFPFFFIISLILALPNAAFMSDDPESPGYALGMVMAVLVGLVLNVIGEAVILFAAFQRLRG